VADTKSHADVATLPFEQALQQLEQIVARLESGNVALEDSIEIYARGQALKDRCDHLLKTAEARIEKIAISSDGQPAGTVALDPER
jgi:exodeoxyribonuclease VII small subunit